MAAVSRPARQCLFLASLLAGLVVAGAAASAQDVSTVEPSAESAAASDSETIGYVDNEACAGCHSAQYDKWLGSHHYHAMAPATQATVQGDFEDARFTHLGKTTRFYTENGRFLVATEGPDGAPGEFEGLYTFGYQPLQQYLLAMPGGRFQALDIAWDTAERRWFHLLPDEPIEPGDPPVPF